MGAEDVARLLAYEEIRQLPARYALALDSRDLDALTALFVEDVRVTREESGRGALRRQFEEMLRPLGVTMDRSTLSRCTSARTAGVAFTPAAVGATMAGASLTTSFPTAISPTTVPASVADAVSPNSTSGAPSLITSPTLPCTLEMRPA